MNPSKSKRVYSPVTKSLAKWLYTIIDRYDWGYRSTTDNRPISKLSSDNFLLLQRNNQWKFNKITQTNIENHLFTNKVFYYRSDIQATHALICLDIDSHRGEKDAIETATYIVNRFHKKCYHEPSTGGAGRHVYLKIDHNNMSVVEFRELLKKYRIALREIIKAKGFEAALDKTCGNHSIRTTRYENGKKLFFYAKDSRGILAKIPKLNGKVTKEESLTALVNAPIQTVKSLKAVIKVSAKFRTQQPQERQPNTTSNIFTSLASNSDEYLQNLKMQPDAFTRMHGACYSFTSHYKRYPYDELELVNYYCGHGLNTGADVHGRREKRAKEVLEHQKSDCPDISVKLFGFIRDQYVSLITKFVNSTHRDEVKTGGHPPSIEDLAIGLYVLESNALSISCKEDWQFTTGNKVIIEMFHKLKEEGVTKRGCNLNKAVAIKQILVNSGLLSVVDENWRFAGPKLGKCKKYGLGEVHPKYDVFLEVVQKAITDHSLKVVHIPIVRASPENCYYLFEDAPAVKQEETLKSENIEDMEKWSFNYQNGQMSPELNLNPHDRQLATEYQNVSAGPVQVVGPAPMHPVSGFPPVNVMMLIWKAVRRATPDLAQNGIKVIRLDRLPGDAVGKNFSNEPHVIHLDPYKIADISIGKAFEKFRLKHNDDDLSQQQKTMMLQKLITDSIEREDLATIYHEDAHEQQFRDVLGNWMKTGGPLMLNVPEGPAVMAESKAGPEPMVM